LDSIIFGGGLTEARTQCAAALCSAGPRRSSPGLSWCQISTCERRTGSGTDIFSLCLLSLLTHDRAVYPTESHPDRNMERRSRRRLDDPALACTVYSSISIDMTSILGWPFLSWRLKGIRETLGRCIMDLSTPTCKQFRYESTVIHSDRFYIKQDSFSYQLLGLLRSNSSCVTMLNTYWYHFYCQHLRVTYLAFQ
jgi:hypothetical protein